MATASSARVSMRDRAWRACRPGSYPLTGPARYSHLPASRGRDLLKGLTMKNALEILHLPVGAVKPSPHGARQHSGAQRRKLKSLIEKFGQVAPIIIDAANRIVDGHAVYDAVCELG